MGDEMIQCHQSIVAGNGPTKGRQVAEMAGKAGGDKGQNLGRDLIWRKACARGGAQAFGQGLAVFGIKVPLPAIALEIKEQKIDNIRICK